MPNTVIKPNGIVMKISAFLKYMLPFSAVVAFAIPSHGQAVTFAKANITVSGGVLTIDESNPGASGLMFKFGSVVGVKGDGKNGDTFYPAADVLFNPTRPAQAVYADWSAIPYTKEGEIIHNRSNVLRGRGDPCRLVDLTKEQIRSGKVDNGKWRSPTVKEYEWFIKKYVDPGGNDKHNCWVETPAPGLLAADDTFFPAAGYRGSSAGVFYHLGVYGYYWSTSPNGVYGWNLTFNSISVYPSNDYRRTFGFPVRCVRQ